MKKLSVILIIFLASACNLTALGQPAQNAPGLVDTLVAQTWEAFQVANPLPASPTVARSIPTITPTPPQTTSIATLFPTATSTQTPIPSFTPLFTTAVPSPTQNPLTPIASDTTTPGAPGQPLCNAATFVKDVTIPDGTQLPPSTTFTKVWRIKNSGTCTWNASYRFVFVAGESMGGQNTSLPHEVEPGGSVDISVNLVAPADTGTYKGNWMLSDGSTNFGGGSNADQPFWVLIEVTQNPAGVVFNFAQSYCSAEWESSAGRLPCPGTEGSEKGFVILLLNPRLENRNENEPTLWTQPEMAKGGWISGTYPEVYIQYGYRFLADVGCLADYPKCKVTFEVRYRAEGEATKKLGAWDEVYDKNITRIDVDLSFLKHKSVVFILAVRVNGVADQGAAFWLQPQIHKP